MASTTEVKWDANYDVLVLGFGGAGATAARFAADAGATVLLVDSAPVGHEGGNTRYSAQLIGTARDFKGAKKYYQNLTAPYHLDEEMIDTFVHGMVEIPNYVQQYLGAEPFSWRDHFPAKGEFARNAYEEFPEYGGAESYDFTTVNAKFFDAALWRLLKAEVSKRADKIDVLYDTPAVKLIQDPETHTVTGAVIKRDGVLRKIHANRGVVLTTGGFENNLEMLADYVGASKLVPLGTLYNDGSGVKLAQSVGADLWHMANYESLGLGHGLAFAVPANERGRLMIGPQNELMMHGSSFVIGDDGTRYFNEAEENRHGHISNHGQWKVPLNQNHPYLIFDAAKKLELDADPIIGKYAPYYDQIITADSAADLGQKLGLDPAKLTRTLAQFNDAALAQNDAEFHRADDSLRTFENGPLYAVPLQQAVLNTQGGPRRNARAEILDTAGQPIPHLYGAGELGGICANQYQGGGNVAECLIFGKIAGENAAAAKDDVHVAPVETATSDFVIESDDQLQQHFTTEPGQYLGRSKAGVGDEIVVRITVNDAKKLQQVEVLQQSESSDVGLAALKELPAQMVAGNTAEVDTVAGASASSNALKAAVKDALDQVN